MSSSYSESEFQALVEQLSDPRTRRLARHKLVSAGAVGPLLGCLDSTNESVVWAAVESLGHMRAGEAVGPLVDLLARGVLVVDVCEALTMITRQDFGANVKRWREWLQESADGSPPGIDVAECVRHAGGYLGVEPTGSENSYQFKLSLPENRTQKVMVYFGRQDPEGDELVVIYSECGPAKPQHYEALLRKNLMIPAGAFAIRDIGGKANLVMVDTMVADAVTPSALAKKIENIASRADVVEKSLAKEDKR